MLVLDGVLVLAPSTLHVFNVHFLIHTCVNQCQTCHVLPNLHIGVILKIALCLKGIKASKWVLGARMRATSHTSQEP